MESIYPKEFARFYDTIYNSLRDGVDQDYYQNQIKATKGPVLEIGAGTGRLYIPALKSGADIYGVDYSPHMLDVLKQKIETKFHSRLSVQDLRNIQMERKFDLVVAPFRVFAHMLNPADQLLALNNIYSLLNPGGKFIFDLYVPDLGILINGFQNHIDFEGEYAPGLGLRRTVSATNNMFTQLASIEFKLEWNENNEWQTFLWESELRFFFRYELEYLTRLSKFRKSIIFGDFLENKLCEESKEFIVHCTR